MSEIKTEIISIGNEILAGWTLNTNAHWIAQKSRDIGLTIQWMTTIADSEVEIKSALKTASTRADVILCTGGLGPTPDDITKNTIASFFDSKLVLDEKTLQHVLKLFESRNIDMPEINRNQALVPETATIINNPVGTAPGLMFQKSKQLFFFMPGVPKEMKNMVYTTILSIIKKTYDLPNFQTYLLRTSGIAESRLFEKLEKVLKKYEDISLSFLPKITGVDIKLKVSDARPEILQRTENFLVEIKQIIQKYVYAEDEKDLQEVVGDLLRSKHLTLAIAESFTGGLIADWITDVPGSSEYFLGAITTYSNESKVRELGVSEETLIRFGAVSKETAQEMSSGIKKLYNCDCAIATTGIAGPTGATATKPVGLCYISVVLDDKIFVKEFHFGTNRRINKERGAMAALESLRRMLAGI